MRMYPREFPSGRRRDPKRRAEREVYEALAGSDRRGFVYYEWRRGYERIELDFAVWVEGLGRVALQVKGGHYLLVDGEWRLKTRDSVKPIDVSPLDEAWLAALDLHDDIEELAETGYNPFVIPALLFPDMEPDPAIEALARRKGVYLVWRTDALMDDLAGLVRSRGVADAVSVARIAREVYAVTDGLIRLGEAGAADTGEEMARPTTLSILAGGRNLLQVRAPEMRLRLGTAIVPGAPRKGRDSRRR